jgi:hypothetical protein
MIDMTCLLPSLRPPEKLDVGEAYDLKVEI